MKRLNFSAFDLASRLSTKSTVDNLTEFLFEDQGYKSIEDRSADLDELLLSQVMQHRLGTPFSIGIILCALAERLGLKVSFIQSPGMSILKSRQGNESVFMDLRQCGKILSRGEILEVLHESQVAAEKISFEDLKDDAVLSLYLRRLTKEYQERGDDQNALIIYEELLGLQPKNLTVLRDRSMAYYRLHRYNESLQDLKRFFSFSDPEQQPPELRDLYSTLQKDLDPNHS